MVGGKQNNNIIDVEQSSEIYFPHWVYKWIELNQEPRIRSIKMNLIKRLYKRWL
jgi:hypothetical protein